MATAHAVSRSGAFKLVKEHTSKPHSGTRSRLLNTMIRSQILTPLPVPINCVEPDGVSPRNRPLEACHFLRAPTPIGTFGIRFDHKAMNENEKLSTSWVREAERKTMPAHLLDSC